MSIIQKYYVREIVLANHETLPIALIAIGTNTASRMLLAREYHIEEENCRS